MQNPADSKGAGAQGPAEEPGAGSPVSPLSLGSFDEFRDHPSLNQIRERYSSRDAIRAERTRGRVMEDIERLSKEYVGANGRSLIVSMEGRVKKLDKVLRKIYRRCLKNGPTEGITQGTMIKFYEEMKDVCGVRFSCPYYDQVEEAIHNVIRPGLNACGYATDLQKDARFVDKNMLDVGDELGYRSYHFYVMVPTQTDIYGTSELVLCEVQARSELQHVWATKSRDLLYNSESGWDFGDSNVVEDMRQVSHSLRAADQHLISVRDRVEGKDD